MLISVCIPCFNAARYIRATLDSVFAQTFADIEIIVLDDGSDDCSFDILCAIGDPRLRVIKGSKQGAAASRNGAYDVSRGSYILFLDSDDLIASDHLALLHDKLKNEPNCVAIGEWDRFWSRPEEAAFPRRETYIDASGPEWLAIDWMHAQAMMQCGMILIPRALIEAYGGWDERLSLIDDFEFFARIIARSAGVRHAPGAKLFYRSGLPLSLSGQKNRRAVESQYLSLELGVGHLLAIENTPRTRRACANLLQAFDYEHYPKHADLRAQVRARVAKLGGANIPPSGPPGFHKLRSWIGWQAARHVQRAAERVGMNRVAREHASKDPAP